MTCFAAFRMRACCRAKSRSCFAFSTNGRPYLRQLSTRSGTWFCDLRRAENLSHALDGWYTPDGLNALLKRDVDRAHKQLQSEPFNYGFPLRYYQQAAIESAETAIGEGRREMLLAMATGTGKTKTCIALIYRLLKAQRFRRVLFLVDRSALGEQAANAFKDTRMESLQAFADVFGVKELQDQRADSETAVHVVTVQGMVHRILNASENEAPPQVDQYDCIVVDECHRGYLLDRELSDTELGFRSLDEYISKYRRVLDYFDAVKIGLTATPALHTTEIFGAPIFSYGWRAKSDGVSQSNINATKLASFSFRLPPIGEQREIVRRVERLLRLHSALAVKAERADAVLKTLTSATLAKAFRGELVAQDPTDEPATELLARVRSSKRSESRDH